MDLPILVSFTTTLILGVATILFSIREEHNRKLIRYREERQRQRLYQISILKEFQDRIGYSLDVERVVLVIIGSLKNFFPYTTASSLLIRPDKIILNTYVEEAVSRRYLDEVNRAWFASLTTLLDGQQIGPIDERVSGILLDEENRATPRSLLHIPVVVNNKITGIITITSQRANSYELEEMELLYQITNSSANTLSRLETVLSTEKGKLLSMIGSLADGVFMVDTNLQISVINESAKKILNITKENPSIIDVLSAIPQPYDLGGKINNAISSQKMLEEKDIQFGQRSVQIFITPVFHHNGQGHSDQSQGNVIGASVLLQDTTLERNLSKIKEDFTNMIVHELRSPLTVIKAASELMVLSKSVTDEKEKKLIVIIEEQSKKLLDQVNSILDAARLEAGRFTIEKIESDLKKVIKEKVDLFTSQGLNRQIQILQNVDESIQPFPFDYMRIGQVMNNLLSNSIKFTPAGGTIRVSAILDQMSNHVIIRVEDTGVGIAPERQKLLFSKFGQISKTRDHGLSQSQSGTGLGLYIVKGIIEAHGGTVDIESQLNKGTTVTFTLPVEETESFSLKKPTANPSLSYQPNLSRVD